MSTDQSHSKPIWIALSAISILVGLNGQLVLASETTTPLAVGESFQELPPVEQPLKSDVELGKTIKNEDLQLTSSQEVVADGSLQTALKNSDFYVGQLTSGEFAKVSAYQDCCGSECDPSCSYTDPGCCSGGDCCTGSGCCSDGCCCQSCCACCRPPCFWLAGVEATFLAPDLNASGVSYRLQDGFAAPALDATFGSDDIAIDDMYVAPRLWLGAQCGCWGIVGRYWNMQAAEDTYDPFTFTPPGPTPDFGYFIHNRFEAYTADIEVTRSFCHYTCRNTFAFGARYASVLHDSALSVDAQLNDGAAGLGILSGNARSNRSAHGMGITTALSGYRPFHCDSCLSLYYNLRGSVVWGPITNSAETDTIELTAGATAGSYNGAFSQVDDALYIGEAQLGVQANYRVMCFPANAFFRVAGEYQYWGASLGSAVASSFAGFGDPNAPPFSEGRATALAQGIDLSLIGLTIGTGFTW
ncbi:hypothetical protein [Bythopirellula polymerisocia]|uniref:Uncharacterized protein n=1 Tax=Bythopirellula polymerisocia TaxID=2528003 RepID=A0A5C6CR94_9BACT|nr:hypothetical protein [Bythopirellula polymerisocia]TWU25961.1 hypothetical protein Pla144_31750 [Bythopirellula polymerisocia]